MDRRNFGKSLIAGAVSAAIAPRALASMEGIGFGRGRLGASGGAAAAFDFYISTTGSAANTGSLSSPWDISVLTATPNSGTANGFQTQIAGKRVGLLPGTYNVYSYCQSSNAAYTLPALSIRSGTSGSPTYIGSSDASGNYSPRTATLDALNPSGGAHPTNPAPIIGQGNYDSGGHSGVGYVTIDGLIITGSYDGGVLFYGTNGPDKVNNQGGSPGCSVLNCEVYNILGTSADNISAVQFWYTNNALCQNCKLHDVTATVSTLGGAGVIMFNTIGSVVEYCTIYNSYNGINSKASQNGQQTVRYCYIEPYTSTFGSNAYSTNLQSFQSSFMAQDGSVHHNILVTHTNQVWDCTTEGTVGATATSSSGMAIYNNTIADLGTGFVNGATSFNTWGSGNSTSPAAQVSHYNNIYSATGNPGYNEEVEFSANTATTPNPIALSDYNCFQSSASATAMLGVVTTVGAGTPGATYTLSGWQANPSSYLYAGVDAHSIAQAAGFVAAASLSPSGYKLATGSPCIGTGRVGGTSGGAAIDMGAWGYDPALGAPPAIIGSNF